ncbi:MAG TPA: flagellar type III secretion system pore protein FliP [Candidatus Acidoferrales bacterium]|nr:flagellar type III secretion system pore protein FliP [Candidatus Acidoferrales bacterium]
MRRGKWVFALLLVSLATPALAAPGLPAVTVQGADGTQTYSLSLQIVALMTALTLLPSLLLAMTAFTRIIIVLAVLRQALGMPQTPPNQVLLGLALFLTLFIMAPVFQEVYVRGLEPYLNDRMSLEQAVEKGMEPLKGFMLAQTREQDIQLFLEMRGDPAPETPAAVPLPVLVAAFMTSELKTAFQIGFVIFIPFLIIDLVVASVLMAMGMMMLSPMLVSLPFKLLLFVLVDGWVLLLGTLASSFSISGGLVG